MKYSLLLVAGALLFVQFAHALPHMKRESVAVKVDSHYSILSEGSSSEEENPQAQLVIYTLAEIAKLLTWMLEKGSIVIKNTVTELEEIPVKDELLQANITRMSENAKAAGEFTLKEDEFSNMRLLLSIVSKFSKMLEDYENMPAESKLKRTLQTALENNGYNKFESEFEEKVLQMAKDYDVAFSKYVKVLSPEEKIKQAKLLKWYEDFKAETNAIKKLSKFGVIFVHLP